MSKKRRHKLTVALVAREIRAVIDQVLTDGNAMPADWIANVVMKHHPRNGASDWYHVCTSAYVRDEVRRQIGRFKEKPETDPQLLLPGFKHLQQAYLVARGGEQTLVPITAMTHDEREAKAQEYEAMGAGCYEHADELRRYDHNIANAA